MSERDRSTACSARSSRVTSPPRSSRESEHTIAFKDINPEAPTHVLVIPRRHEPDIGSLAAADPDAAIALLTEARAIAESGRQRLLPPGVQHRC